MKNSFPAFIRNGKHDNEQEEKIVREHFEGKRVEISYSLFKKKRSVKQNRATFGIPYRMIAEALTEQWGEIVTVETVHSLMKDRFESILQEHSIEPYEPKEIKNATTGKAEYLLPILSTTKLSTVGMMKYYEAMQQFGAQFLNINIPSPNEEA